MTIRTVGLGGTYSTIQAAVDAAGNGDTIEIAAGIYREQVTVDGKDITIHGAGSDQTIIESPDAASLVANAIDTNSGRPNKFAVITVTDNADVTIEGLTVDGRDQGAVPASNYVTGSNHDFLGIYVLNSDAHIDGVAVTGADELAGPDVSGVQRNHGILVTGHDAAHGGSDAGYTVEIENSTVSGFQKTGIFVNGSTLTANVHDNTIVGAHTANTAQNGIQVGSLFGVVGDGDFSGTHATIDHNTITDIGNSGPAGSASGIIVFAGDASTVSITNNTLTGWAAPQANGNSGITFVDSNGGTVTGNTISGFDAGLNVLDQFGGTLHTPVSHSGNIYNNDVVNVALEPNPAGTTGLTFSGSDGHDELTGNAGADTLSGLGGNDAIVGGSGVDTAAYTATISTSGITDDGAGHFVVATGGSEGTDTLSGVEKIDGAGTHNILLVGNGGYATIQAAVNAAADGDTIEIAAGTYTEDVTITGKALTIDGVENGSVNSVTLNGQITVAGTLNGAFAITDLNINATGKDYGVSVTANSTGICRLGDARRRVDLQRQAGRLRLYPCRQRLDPDSGRHHRRGVDPQQPVPQQRDREQPGGRPRRHPAVRIQPGPDHHQCRHRYARRLRAEGDPDARHRGRRRRQRGSVRPGRRRRDQQPDDHRRLRPGRHGVLPDRRFRQLHRGQ